MSSRIGPLPIIPAAGNPAGYTINTQPNYDPSGQYSGTAIKRASACAGRSCWRRVSRPEKLHLKEASVYEL